MLKKSYAISILMIFMEIKNTQTHLFVLHMCTLNLNKIMCINDG